MGSAHEDSKQLEELKANVEDLKRSNVALRQQYEEMGRAVSSKADGAQVDAKFTQMENDAQRRIQAQKDMEQWEGRALAAEYLTVNQLAYALCALPIGTVLSIAPLYLKNQMDVPVVTVGYLMMGGELLGIAFMKYAEISSTGFVLRRPHDVHLILLAVAVCLLAIPLWPARLWYGAASSMILVQAFNSASKPVIAEAVYRLAVVTNSETSTIFAVANKWRRVGNAIVGATTPLAYMANPSAAFFASAPILVVFTLCMISCKRKVDEAVQKAETHMRLLRASYEMRPKAFRIFARVPWLQRAQSERDAKGSVIQAIESMASEAGSAGAKQPGRMASLLQSVLGVDVELKNPALRGSEMRFQFLLFAVVHVFPFMDAFISRLPFAFLTIAIADQSGNLAVACLVLFSYQSCRAIGQSMQASCGTSNVLNYLLTLVSVVAYGVVFAAVSIDSETSWWFYPLISTGLSETLAVQQFYLVRLLTVDPSSETGSDRVRELVKASHTGTGVGSAVAFYSSSAVYATFSQRGISILGLGVAIAKLVLIIFIGSNLPSAPAEQRASEACSSEEERPARKSTESCGSDLAAQCDPQVDPEKFNDIDVIEEAFTCQC